MSGVDEVLSKVQDDIAASNPHEHYAKAYRAEERGYWSCVPEWMNKLDKGGRVADIGAAYGTLAVLAKRLLGSEVTVVDATTWYYPSKLFAEEGIRHVKRDAEREDLSDLGVFDAIIFTEVLEHLNFQPDHTLNKLHSALKPGGTLFLSTPDANSNWGRCTTYYNSLEQIPPLDLSKPWIDGHIWQYTADELEMILKRNGFVVEEMRSMPGARPGYLHLNVLARRSS